MSYRKPIQYYRCTVCKRTEVDIAAKGCGDPESRKVMVPCQADGWGVIKWRQETAACPMILRRLRDRFLYRFFGVLP